MREFCKEELSILGNLQLLKLHCHAPWVFGGEKDTMFNAAFLFNFSPAPLKYPSVARATCWQWSYSNSSTAPTTPSWIFMMTGRKNGVAFASRVKKKNASKSVFNCSETWTHLELTAVRIFCWQAVTYSHGNEIYIAFGKYMEVALHTYTIDSLMSKS